MDYAEDVAKALNLLHSSSEFPTLTPGEQRFLLALFVDHSSL